MTSILKNPVKSSKALAVAYFFINRYNLGENEATGLTNKKLQKLLYYSQAWSLVLRNKKLFHDEIEAWVHGPAIKAVYGEFKKYGYDNIKTEADKEYLSLLSEDEKELLMAVWEVYGQYDATYLEALTHSERPWQEARSGLEIYETSSNVISQDTMKAYYGEKIKKD